LWDPAQRGVILETYVICIVNALSDEASYKLFILSITENGTS